MRNNSSALAFGRRTALVALLGMALAGGSGASLAWADTTSPAQDTPVLISADQPEGSNAEKTTAEGLVYTIDEDGAKVTGYSGSSASVAIPYDIEGAPVVTVSLNKAGIAVLDLSRCSALQELSCSGNKLASLDLSACPQLKKLTCRDNAIATLDLSGCSELTYLLCANNALTKLDLTSFPDLYFLNCYDNKIATLKITGLSKFKWFNCGDNKLKGTLDLSSSTGLKMVTASKNKLTAIKTPSSSELIYLDVSNNMLSSVNLKRLPGIRLLNCERNQQQGPRQHLLPLQQADHRQAGLQGQHGPEEGRLRHRQGLCKQLLQGRAHPPVRQLQRPHLPARRLLLRIRVSQR